jgi:hypothetical protein
MAHDNVSPVRAARSWLLSERLDQQGPVCHDPVVLLLAALMGLSLLGVSVGVSW